MIRDKLTIKAKKTDNLQNPSLKGSSHTVNSFVFVPETFCYGNPNAAQVSAGVKSSRRIFSGLKIK